MARARNIKPGFFTNDVLGELDPLARILFAGMWCHADRLGRLEDRPKKLKAEILPYDTCDVDVLAQCLHDASIVHRYVVDGKRYIQIINFTKHQNPHIKEQASTIPAPGTPDTCTEVAGLIPSSLIPDSLNLIPSTLIPDSLISESNQEKSNTLQPATPTAKKKKELTEDETALQAVCRETWRAYSDAFADRYGIAPERNPKINSQIKQFCKLVAANEAPAIAAFYVRHNASRYVAAGHAVGLLVLDAAPKLRTEWATNRTITTTQAQQADRTQANGNIWGEIIEEARERERNEAIQQTQ